MNGTGDGVGVFLFLFFIGGSFPILVFGFWG